MKKSYHRCIPATLLTMIKALLGLASLALLFIEVILMIDLQQEAAAAIKLAAGPLKFTDRITLLILNGIDRSGSLAAALNDIIITFRNFALITFLILFVLFFIRPLLSALDGIGAIILRFTGKSGLTKIVHTIDAALAMISQTAYIAGIVVFWLSGKQMIESGLFASDDYYVFAAAFTATMLIFSLVPLFRFSYHKDIVQAVRTASDDYNDNDPELIRNHLSGITMVAFALHAVSTVIFLIVAICDMSANSAEDSSAALFVIAGIFALLSLKYLLIIIVNNDMRDSFKERDLTRRFMSAPERLIIAIPTAAIFALMVFGGLSGVSGFKTFVSDVENALESIESIDLVDPLDSFSNEKNAADAAVTDKNSGSSDKNAVDKDSASSDKNTADSKDSSPADVNELPVTDAKKAE